MIQNVRMTKYAVKDLENAPEQVQIKFEKWVDGISRIGLAEMRKISGYHDEQLKGKRKGQRSVRLNKQWRILYHIKGDNSIEIIEILEITPHDY